MTPAEQAELELVDQRLRTIDKTLRKEGDGAGNWQCVFPSIANDAILENLYSTGVPIMRGVGGSMQEFVMDWAAQREAYLKQVDKGEILPDGSLPTKKAPRKRPASKKVAAGPVPTRFDARYPMGTMPIYAQQQVEPASDQSSSADHASRFLELKLPAIQEPHDVFLRFLMTYIRSADDKLLPAGDDGGPEVVRWDQIQATAFVEATTDEEACMFGSACIGKFLYHPDGSFAFRRWHHARRKPGLCYADIVNYFNLIRETDKTTGRSSADVESPFLYLIGVAGEYKNASAFRRCVEGNNEGSTRAIRHFMMTDLVPRWTTGGGERLRKFEERIGLRYDDGSRRVAQLEQVHPSSYTSFDIEPVTNERILLAFVFRDMAWRYRKFLGRDVPTHLQVCRLGVLAVRGGSETDGGRRVLPHLHAARLQGQHLLHPQAFRPAQADRRQGHHPRHVDARAPGVLADARAAQRRGRAVAVRVPTSSCETSRPRRA